MMLTYCAATTDDGRVTCLGTGSTWVSVLTEKKSAVT